MDDSGPFRLLTALGLEREQPVDERAGGVPGRRMDDEAGRLVDDQQVLVLVGDAEVHRLRLERRTRRLRRLELELLAALELPALRPRAAVDEHRRKYPLRDAARADLRQSGEEAVEPLARRRVRNVRPERQNDATAVGRRRRA